MNIKKFDETPTVEIERKETRTTADITTRCPICKLLHIEYDEFDDEWHKITCDRCGTTYKYKCDWY